MEESYQLERSWMAVTEAQKRGFKLGCCETDFNDEVPKYDPASGNIEYIE